MNKTPANKAIDLILVAFENGNLPEAIAYSTFTPPSNIPAYKWSMRNRVIAFLQHTGDARGYSQWKEVGRNVKKGSKAIYILGPILKKSNKTNNENGMDNSTTKHDELDIMQCVGYHVIPVFRMEDTEGEPLQYAHIETKSLPLIEVAERFGVEVKAGAFNGNYYGYYSNDKKEIVLASDNERTFLHELAHAAHYRIDPNIEQAKGWEKEIIAELSAGALLYMMGKDGHIGNHYKYITKYAEEAKLTTAKACIKVVDTCLKVIDEITRQANQSDLQAA